MKQFPPNTEFKYKWRPYQARVLAELEEHLGDDNLHVVAAPGSGKTLLGLEVARRIDNPTLILAPTLAIRDQWISRLVHFFLDKDETPNWISRDVRNPDFLTVTTYQALYMACGGSEDEWIEDADSDEEENTEDNGTDIDQIVKSLNKKGVTTVVLDEAHHLRANWWRTLTEVMENLGAVKTVSLTATPPYDVSFYEWERYIQLCGPIDAEVSVPELVREGNLCPHQDLVILTAPTFIEDSMIKEFKKSIELFINDLRIDDSFLDLVQNHTWIRNPDSHIEEILENPEFYSSLLIYLHSRKFPIPELNMELVAGQHFGLPKLDEDWIETLLEGILFPPDVKAKDLHPTLKSIKNRLYRLDALEQRRVNLRTTSELDKTLKRSITKLHAILTIVKLERQALGRKLRMVILTDFIRKVYLPSTETDIPDLDRIGVVPIFEFLRRTKLNDCKIGVLSGSLVVLPEESEKLLIEAAQICEIEESSIKIKKLPFEGYVEVDLIGSDSARKVQVITEVLMRGGIQVLVGTKSLLGEGWDAPVVNSLILATFVGSYMLSNQMRGRAIRTDPNEKQKTSNIWHLICVETDTPRPGNDYETMRRRFRAFLGVSLTEQIIENGFDRLGIGNPPFTIHSIKQVNQAMAEHALDRESLKAAWEASLRLGEEGIRLVEEVKTKKTRLPLPRGFVFRNTLEALVWQLILLAGLFIAGRLPGLVIPLDIFEITLLSYLPFIGFLFFSIRFFPKFVKAIWMFIKHGPIKSSIRQVGRALLYSLCQMGIVKTAFGDMNVIVDENKRGEVFCHIEGGTRREMAIYLETLEEILGPIESPRYILVRKSSLRGTLTRHDYHSVPSILGIKKEFAKQFADSWTRFVGEMDLVYTRTREGRLVLLKARNQSLSAGFRKRSERVSRWK